MINLQLLTMQEYIPVNRDEVDIYLCDKARLPRVGISLLGAMCEVTYQEYGAKDRYPLPSWSSNTDEEMNKIPFNTPFVHITEPFCPPRGDVEHIVGFRVLDEDEMQRMSVEAAHAEFYHFGNEDYTPAEEISYWEKRWYFILENGNHVHDDDPENQVLGIRDKDQLAVELKEELKRCLGA